MVIVKKHKMTDIPTLKRQFTELTARGALVTLVQRYGMAAKNFVWNGQLYTVDTALKQLPDYLLDMKCGDFGIVRFFGGPPKAGNWFDGTVLTMLCDAVLFEGSTEEMPEGQKLAV
jgi:hypothetical protein